MQPVVFPSLWIYRNRMIKIDRIELTIPMWISQNLRYSVFVYFQYIKSVRFVHHEINPSLPETCENNKEFDEDDANWSDILTTWEKKNNHARLYCKILLGLPRIVLFNFETMGESRVIIWERKCLPQSSLLLFFVSCIYKLVVVGDHFRGQPEGSLFSSYYTEL